jgi:hypothetical protein
MVPNVGRFRTLMGALLVLTRVSPEPTGPMCDHRRCKSFANAQKTYLLYPLLKGVGQAFGPNPR